MIRKACDGDIESVVSIYDEIHSGEEEGLYSTGWKRYIYPTRDTALYALKNDELYVMEDTSGNIVASARFNKSQEECYRLADWAYDTSDEDVFVLHTLAVSPTYGNRGFAGRFIQFYEELAIKNGCSIQRMDTNAINIKARKMYRHYGFREAGIVPCEFNGIQDVELVCLEKQIGMQSRDYLSCL